MKNLSQGKNVLSTIETDLVFAIIMNDQELLEFSLQQKQAIKIARAWKEKYDGINNIKTKNVDWVQIRRLFSRVRRAKRFLKFLI